MKRLLLVLFALLMAIGAFAANPPYTAFIGTNGILIRSNVGIGKILVDGGGITNGSSPVFVTTNLFVVNNTYTSNLFTTNIFVNQTLVTSNVFTTNLTVQSITVFQTLFAISNIFVSNIYVTNIVVNNINVNSNLFVTNAFFSGITTNSGTISSRVLILPTTAGLGWFNGTNQWYSTNLTANVAVLLTNLVEGADYYLQVSNPASFAVTFTSIGADSWIEHPYVAGTAVTNGITLFKFQRWGTKTNAFEVKRSLTLTNDDGSITFLTNQDTLVIRAAPGGITFGDLVWTNDNNDITVISTITTNIHFSLDGSMHVGPEITNGVFIDVSDPSLKSINVDRPNANSTLQADDNGFAMAGAVNAAEGGSTRFDVFGIGDTGGGLSTVELALQIANRYVVLLDPTYSVGPTSYLFSSAYGVTNTDTLLSLQNSNTPMFEVNGIGDLKLLKRVAYSWPSAQGAAQTVLTNDGAGNLGWGVVTATGGAGSQIWTNDGKFFYPSGTIVSNTAQIIIATNNGGIEIGSNTATLFQPIITSFGGVLYSAVDTDTGANDLREIVLLSTASGTNTAFGAFKVSQTDGSILDLDWNGGGGNHSYCQPVVDIDGPHLTAVRSNQVVLSFEPRGTFGAMLLLDNFQDSPDAFLIQSNGTAMFKVDPVGDLTRIRRITYSWPSAQGAAATVLTNNGSGVLGWGTVAAVNPLAGTTNILNLSVQAAKLPVTNYPAIDAGWQAWETVYAETNAEGARVNTSASWQFMVPPDYATNTLKLLINYSLSSTNGPNTSNVVFGASILQVRSGTTNNVHTNLFGSIVRGSNNWIAKYDGTNIVTNLVIDLGVNSLLMPRDVGVLKLERFPTEDTYGGAVAVHGLQLEYTRP